MRSDPYVTVITKSSRILDIVGRSRHKLPQMQCLSEGQRKIIKTLTPAGHWNLLKMVFS